MIIKIQSAIVSKPTFLLSLAMGTCSTAQAVKNNHNNK